jgi:putative membrane protein insertion efficiency factor
MIKQFTLGMIVVYRRVISPLLGPRCRFYPTCSDYAHQAITIHGLYRGGRLAVWRLLRCHPFNKGPFLDPVPQSLENRDAMGYNALHAPKDERKNPI